jgi:hypothetical protein
MEPEQQSELNHELGAARRRRALRTQSTNPQAIIVAAIPVVVLLAVVAMGVWLIQSRKQATAARATPTHLPTLPPATLVAAVKVATLTAVPSPSLAPATPTSGQQVSQPTATPEPTLTPTPEPVVVEPTATPETVAVLAQGTIAEVSGTNGRGLRLRVGPSINEATIEFLPDGSKVTILGGPKEADGYSWYNVRDESGTEGWAAGQWLQVK